MKKREIWKYKHMGKIEYKFWNNTTSFAKILLKTMQNFNVSLKNDNWTVVVLANIYDGSPYVVADNNMAYDSELLDKLRVIMVLYVMYVAVCSLDLFM